MSMLARAGAAAMQGARRHRVERLDFSDLSPLVWLDAQDVVHVSGAISACPDKGSSGLTFSQATETRKPQRVTSAAFGGRKVFSADGGDVLTSESAAGIQIAEDDDFDLLFVGSMSIEALRVVWSTEGYSGGSVSGMTLDPRNTGGSRLRVGDGTTDIVETDHNVGLDTPFALRARLAGAASTSLDTGTLYLDGSAGTPTQADLANPIITGARVWNFLASNSSASSGFQGEAACLLMFDRLLDAGELSTITSRINAWFGLSLAGV